MYICYCLLRDLNWNKIYYMYCIVTCAQPTHFMYMFISTYLLRYESLKFSEDFGHFWKWNTSYFPFYWWISYRVNKNVDVFNLVHTTRFWKNHHQVRLGASKPRGPTGVAGKTNELEGRLTLVLINYII